MKDVIEKDKLNYHIVSTDYPEANFSDYKYPFQFFREKS